MPDCTFGPGVTGSCNWRRPKRGADVRSDRTIPGAMALLGPGRRLRHRLGNLHDAGRAGALRQPRAYKLGRRGHRRHPGRGHARRSGPAPAQGRRALCLCAGRLWRFRGLSGCLGVLDILMGRLGGHRHRLCGLLRRLFSGRNPEPRPVGERRAGGHLVLGRGQLSGRARDRDHGPGDNAFKAFAADRDRSCRPVGG